MNCTSNVGKYDFLIKNLKLGASPKGMEEPGRCSTPFINQYNKTYEKRIELLKPRIVNTIKTKLGKDPVPSIIDISISDCVIIGVLFISSDLKPSIFDELKLVKDVKSTLPIHTYHSKDVKFFVEDTSGKVELEFEDMDRIYKDHFILSTGMVLGFLGKETKKGKFLVRDVYFPGYNLERPRSEEVDATICFISGVGIREDDKNNVEKIKILVDYISGLFGEKKSIVECVIIGDLLDVKDVEETLNLLKIIDELLSTIPYRISFVPGINDPTSKVFPQDPIHEKLLNTKINSLSNPSFTKIQGRSCIISSGSNVEDLLKYLPQSLEHVQGEASDYRMHLAIEESDMKKTRPITCSENFLNAMDVLLKLQYLCPTAPDTLKCAPLSEKDPFIIDETCDFFIVGNSSEYGKRTVNAGKTVLLSIPNFNSSGEIILYNFSRNEEEIIKFT
jgi:DNA polymerase delta subunit 2